MTAPSAVRILRPTVQFNSPYLRWFPASVQALALGSTIYVRGDTITRTQLEHERVHIRQFAQRGLLRGCVEYALLALLYGYAKHPWEVEARRAAAGRCPSGTCDASL